MHHISWLVWLATPVVITVLFALKLWWGGLPHKPTGPDAIQAHRAYLDALGASIEKTHKSDQYAQPS